MPDVYILVLEEARPRVEVEAEGGEGIMALANAKFFLHRDQTGRALGQDIMRERGWKEQ